MKKFAIIICFAICLPVFAGIPFLRGVWTLDNVELTFLDDTLIIDEIDNEGDEYIYSADSVSGTIKAWSTFHECDSFVIKIVNVTEDSLYIYYTDDDEAIIYGFGRKK